MHKLLKSSIFSSLILLFIFSGLSNSAKEYQVSTVAENLEHPWSIAFLPNGDMLVTEREGHLRLIQDRKLLEQSITGLPEIYVQGQGGLFDVLVDPAFNTNQKLYISFASGDRSANALKVISARLEGMQLKDIKTILTISPTKDTPHHFGGRMALMRDGSLLVTSGEGFNFPIFNKAFQGIKVFLS